MTEGPALEESAVAADPIEQFARWYRESVDSGVDEAEAMCLATAAGGQPAARMVLLKGFDHRGFVFYTNYRSAKARDLAANPNVALMFRWYRLGRQVRILGEAGPVPAEESDAYFASRDRQSRLGAWASPQSDVLPDRAALESALAGIEARFAGDDVPRPPWWGGYRVVPSSVELWQQRPSRLHDRLRYRLVGGQWRIERLAP